MLQFSFVYSLFNECECVNKPWDSNIVAGLLFGAMRPAFDVKFIVLEQTLSMSYSAWTIGHVCTLDKKPNASAIEAVLQGLVIHRLIVKNSFWVKAATCDIHG